MAGHSAVSRTIFGSLKNNKQLNWTWGKQMFILYICRFSNHQNIENIFCCQNNLLDLWNKFLYLAVSKALIAHILIIFIILLLFLEISFLGGIFSSENWEIFCLADPNFYTKIPRRQSVCIWQYRISNTLSRCRQCSTIGS